MTIYRTLSKLLSALALLGMLLSPLASSAMAMPMSAHDMADMPVAMSGDKPCCADEAPAKNCGKTCPLMAICVIQALPAEVGFVYRPFGARMSRLALDDDAPLDGRAENPPPEPPKFFI